MTAPERPKLLKHLWIYTLLSGLLSVILGVLVTLHPGNAVWVAAIFLGASLVFRRVAQSILAFSLHVSAGGRVMLFISGAASLVLAVLAFKDLGDESPMAIVLLAIWIAVSFIFRGVSTAVTAISDPGMPGRGWAIFFGVISILAGIVVMASPIDSLGLLGV